MTFIQVERIIEIKIRVGTWFSASVVERLEVDLNASLQSKRSTEFKQT